MSSSQYKAGLHHLLGKGVVEGCGREGKHGSGGLRRSEYHQNAQHKILKEPMRNENNEKICSPVVVKAQSHLFFACQPHRPVNMLSFHVIRVLSISGWNFYSEGEARRENSVFNIKKMQSVWGIDMFA